MKYFYARVSTKDQNLARQLEAARQYKDDIDRVFTDKQSGKSFDRPQYQEMKHIVRCGDEVIVKSLDRLGRNKDGIKDELAWFRQAGVIVRVLDIATTLVEWPTGQEWVMDMVNNILIEVIAAIAEQERITTKQRQSEGIAAMPIVDGRRVSEKTGRGLGRPKCVIDETEFRKIAQKQKSGLLTVQEACAELGISRSKWYTLAKEAG